MSQPEHRHLKCSICSQLRDKESATESVHEPEKNTDFPEAVSQLKVIKAIRNNLDLMQCPECKTYYLYRTHYEYLIGFGGSYDEYILLRISGEMGKAYLEGQPPPACPK